MKKALVCLVLSICSATAVAAPMSRVIAVTNSNTLVVVTNGLRASIVLSGVSVAAEEESAAADHLRRTVAHAWVYIENGEIYRSPDGLYVNGEMLRHAWRTSPSMKFLGELELGPRAKNQPAGNQVKSAPTLPPPRTAKPTRRGTSASRSGSRRAGRAR